MRRRLERLMEDREAINKLYNAPANRKIKYTIFGLAGVAVLLSITMIIWMDVFSWKTFHILRGCVGICGILIFILSAILVYRVNSQHINNRFNKKP